VTRFEAAAWLTAPSTLAVLDALEAAGGAGCVRVVGGAVRNALMGRPVEDVDLATAIWPDQVIAALETAGLKAVPTGLAHGTVTAVSGGRGFEVTTLRRDVATDGRHAVVTFTDDWAEDAARRDFRLNALYVDREGRVFDPTGEGVADALAGRVVFVGDPARRITEDYLRILRFFRFSAWHGTGVPDPVGLAACAAGRGGLARLSAERVSKELLKLLSAPDPRAAVSAMDETGVLALVLPEAVVDRRFMRLTGMSDDALLRLAALLPDDPQSSAAVAARLRLSNAQRDRLVAVTDLSVAVGPELVPASMRAALYRLGRETVRDRLTLAEATLGPVPAELQAMVEHWPIPRLPVGGADLARLGIPPGPATGEILRAFEAAWIADDFPADGHEVRLRQLIEAAR
jgi:poly(A) polymerase